MNAYNQGQLAAAIIVGLGIHARLATEIGSTIAAVAAVATAIGIIYLTSEEQEPQP